MKKQQVYMEVDINTLTPEQKKNIIQSRWVLRDKGNNVRARIVAKGYTEAVNDLDDIYASTPIFCVLRTLLTICLNRGWIARTGDISTAFLHAAGNSRLVHVSTKGVLQTRGQHHLETPQSNLWTEKQSKSLAKPPYRSPPTTWTSTQHSRAQHLYDTNKRLLYPRLRR